MAGHGSSPIAAAVLAILTVAVISATPARAAPLVGHEIEKASVLGDCLASIGVRCLAATDGSAADPGRNLGWLGVATIFASISLPTTETASLNLTPIPLPAAGFLLMAGLGALGMLRRRCNGETVHLRTALSESSRMEVNSRRPIVVPRLFPRTVVRDRRIAAAVGRLRAFAPGRSSPTRPVGGAAMRYAATAERAPPTAGVVTDRNGNPARPNLGGRDASATMQPKLRLHSGILVKREKERRS